MSLISKTWNSQFLSFLGSLKGHLEVVEIAVDRRFDVVVADGQLHSRARLHAQVPYARDRFRIGLQRRSQSSTSNAHSNTETRNGQRKQSRDPSARPSTKKTRLNFVGSSQNVGKTR